MSCVKGSESRNKTIIVTPGFGVQALACAKQRSLKAGLHTQNSCQIGQDSRVSLRE
jgi:hypothetical protein